MNKQLFAIIAIIGLSFVTSKTKADCIAITCTDNNSVAENASCASKTKNANGSGYSVSVQTCKTGFYCPNAMDLLGTLNSVNCVKDPNYSLLGNLKDFVSDAINGKDYCLDQAPGEDCNSNDHCSTKKCTNDKCEGKKLDEACTSSNKECNVGLYCNLETKKCATQRTDGQSCISHEDCANTHGCMGGKCVKYYSLADGVETTEDVFCSSANIKSGIKKVCDTVTLSTNDCTKDSNQCGYTYSDKTTVSLECQCDMITYTGNVFCPPIGAKKTIYEGVHTSRSWVPACKPNANMDKCIGEATQGVIFTNLNNSVINKVGLVLLAALMMLF